MDEKQFVLIDLERTIKTGVAHYWKAGGMGYTRDVDGVGFYDERIARDHVVNDFDRMTVGVSAERFKTMAGVE